MSTAIRKRDILLFYCSVVSTRAKSCYATNEVRARLEKHDTTPSIAATLGGMSFIPRLNQAFVDLFEQACDESRCECL